VLYTPYYFTARYNIAAGIGNDVILKVIFLFSCERMQTLLGFHKLVTPGKPL
jgi:hypothetical protein